MATNKKIIRIHEPFLWAYHVQNKSKQFAFGSGVFIWLFLALTLPFGINNSNVSEIQLFLMLMPVGIIWIASLLITDLFFIRVFKVSIKSNSLLDIAVWAIKLTLVVHLIFAIRGSLCDWACLDVYEYLQLWFAFLFMFSICYTTFALYAKGKISQIRLANGNIKENSEGISIGKNKDKIKVNPKHIIYCKSDDNYVDVFLNTGNTSLQKKSLRVSLKTLQTQLSFNPEFVRIHRSYIINTSYFSNYSKGYNTLTLQALDAEITLPVSRKYKPEVTRLFDHHNF
mgnify:CR=1 FL=1